jgi:hypothetical protein
MDYWVMNWFEQTLQPGCWKEIMGWSQIRRQQKMWPLLVIPSMSLSLYLKSYNIYSILPSLFRVVLAVWILGGLSSELSVCLSFANFFLIYVRLGTGLKK